MEFEYEFRASTIDPKIWADLRSRREQLEAENAELRAELKTATQLVADLDDRVHALGLQVEAAREALEEATDTLEACRYSEQPMAKKCRQTLSTLTTGNAVKMIEARALREAASVAARFSIDKKQIHPDIAFDDMSDQARGICHSTCQSVAVEISKLAEQKEQ